MLSSGSSSHLAMPDYSLYLPRVLGYPFFVATGAVLFSVMSIYLFENSFTAGFVFSIVLSIVSFLYLIAYVGITRFIDLDRRLRARDKMLSGIQWQGNETVLDVGCGNGILTFGAAKKLTVGKVTGIDIWSDRAGDSSLEKFNRNALVEGVVDKVEFQNVDVCELEYADACFDVILCGLAMHHIAHGESFDRAISEMVRVLKPGGWIVVYDIALIIFFCKRQLRHYSLDISQISKNIIICQKI